MYYYYSAMWNNVYLNKPGGLWCCGVFPIGHIHKMEKLNNSRAHPVHKKKIPRVHIIM